MKTISTLDEVMKPAGTPLARLLGPGDNVVARDQTAAASERPVGAREGLQRPAAVGQELPNTLSDGIGGSAEIEDVGDRETRGDSLNRADDKMVFIPGLANRKAAVESPCIDVTRLYSAMEERKADALESFVFILLWLSSLFALGYCLTV